MEKHVTVLGILYIAFSALGLLLAVIVFAAVVGGGIISGDSEAMAITAIVGPAVAAFLLLLSIPVKPSALGQDSGAGSGISEFHPYPHRNGAGHLHDLGVA